ncbi:MAG: hypothetical protein HC831_16485 [Chloroflexia bacterium]|nr:hypothetical protein [Chloroflexia bacterium]
MTITKLNYTVDNTNGKVYERIDFVKGGMISKFLPTNLTRIKNFWDAQIRDKVNNGGKAAFLIREAAFLILVLIRLCSIFFKLQPAGIVAG